MFHIGPYEIKQAVLLAPMAGVSDLPFRHAVRQFGVGMTVAEMVSAKPALQHSHIHQQRRVSLDEPLPRAIQIVGNDPNEMADAAALNQALGAGLIDINMGCPAKKVCRKAAGSALLADPAQVQAILEAVVSAVSVPVSLKIRTGISIEANNAVEIAKMAENCGVQSLVVHGRSRACMFKGHAEYESIRRVKAAVGIPVIANGDIDSPKKARAVLDYTGADAVMIGRAAQGKPWLPAMIHQYLVATHTPMNNTEANNTEALILEPSLAAQKQACLTHITMAHAYYGEKMGVKIARKHIRWYLAAFDDGSALSKRINQLNEPKAILGLLSDFYDRKIDAQIAAKLEGAQVNCSGNMFAPTMATLATLAA